MKKDKCLFFIFCSAVGPPGTGISFYPSKEGLVSVWENGNCPYPPDDKYHLGDNSSWRDENTGAAKDGHNVDTVPWAKIEDALYHAIKKGLYNPTKLRRL